MPKLSPVVGTAVAAVVPKDGTAGLLANDRGVPGKYKHMIILANTVANYRAHGNNKYYLYYTSCYPRLRQHDTLGTILQKVETLFFYFLPKA